MKNNNNLFSAQIIIPTFNAGIKVCELFKSIKRQKNIDVKVLIIDSESTDETREIAKTYGYRVKKIKHKDFNHGGTRQLGVELCSDVDFIVFLTQDVILANEYSIVNLLRSFKNEEVGCAYGRQLPHKNATILSAHARFFNYPLKSEMKSINDAKILGIKTAFISNSFAAYRKKALEEIGGFPKNVVSSEDIYVAAKMLLNKWKNYYCAEATVYHSHNYTIIEEYRRYFNIGLFHGQEKWIKKFFEGTEREGLKFVLSEVKYIIEQKKYSLLIFALVRNCLKYIGYKTGEMS